MEERFDARSAPDGHLALGGALLDDDAVHELLQQVTTLAEHRSVPPNR